MPAPPASDRRSSVSRRSEVSKSWSHDVAGWWCDASRRRASGWRALRPALVRVTPWPVAACHADTASIESVASRLGVDPMTLMEPLRVSRALAPAFAMARSCAATQSTSLRLHPRHAARGGDGFARRGDQRRPPKLRRPARRRELVEHDPIRLNRIMLTISLFCCKIFEDPVPTSSDFALAPSREVGGTAFPLDARLPSTSPFTGWRGGIARPVRPAHLRGSRSDAGGRECHAGPFCPSSPPSLRRPCRPLPRGGQDAHRQGGRAGGDRGGGPSTPGESPSCPTDGCWSPSGRAACASFGGRQVSRRPPRCAKVEARGQGGLLDVVLDPRFAKNRPSTSYASPSDGAPDRGRPAG